MFEVIIGALSAIAGGFLATWYTAKHARRIRMDEIIAEKKVDANKEAYAYMVEIRSKLIQDTLENTSEEMAKYEDWFFNNRLFLPGKFPGKWLSLRNHFSTALRLQKTLEKNASRETADELSQLYISLKRLADEAINEIYKEMKLEDIALESPYWSEPHRLPGSLKSRLWEYVCQKCEKTKKRLKNDPP